jgi:Isoleucyl-tRNA synthetase (EC 6.1.1.5)
MNDAAPDYRKTLNLPRTEFPMQANLARREPERLARWREQGLYAAVQAAGADRPVFRLVDGPPYANGDIHIGHAVNKVLKDIIVKSRRLDGDHAPFVPGWDCHGLPIELQVEKKHGKVGVKLDAAAFRAKCREYAAEQVARQREDFQRLGVLADWDRPYLTMDPRFEAEQLRVLARIVDNGHVVRGFKPVHWCLDCGSSLAEAEVEYQDKTSTTVDVAFPAADPAAVARAFGLATVADAAFVIWTTTPWSLPGNQALQLNPELDYVLADFAGRRLVLAQALVESCAKRWGTAAPTILGRAPGAALIGLVARHPFADRPAPVIASADVALDVGTGIVHSAPAHGAEDYVACKAAGIEVKNPVGADGVFLPDTPVVAGVHLRKAEPLILDALRERGALVLSAPLQHSYPHCWRHKSPLVTLATPQWFMSMEARGLRAGALAAIETTRFIPKWGRDRIHGMVAERPDWCISRQRTWGVPLALFVHRREQTPHPESAALLRRVADRVEAEGLEAWFASSVADWLPAAEVADYDKCPDTLDVWFDSGCVHQCSFVDTDPAALDADGLAPQADLYLEGSDQHRGWFQSSLLTSVAMRGRAPYQAVLTHGFTVDDQGRKMSKSLGNVVAPQKVVDSFGADVLRLWVAASDYRGEIAGSNELIQRVADTYRRIRNTVRFLLSNLADFDPASDALEPAELLDLDRAALLRAGVLQAEFRRHYAEAEFHLLCQKLHHWCVAEMGGVYLDVLKDRLYTMPATSRGRRSAQTVLWHLAEAMVRWIAPILSFTADEIWESLPGARSGSVFSAVWHALPAAPAEDAHEATRWARLREAREAVALALEPLRKSGAVGGTLDIDLRLHAEGAIAEALRSLGDELRFWFITSSAEVSAWREDAPGEDASLASGGRLRIEACASTAPKCGRCWQHRADVGVDPAHPTVCGRCVDNLQGSGEERRHV